MQKLDLLLNYDCLGSERNLRALNLASRIGIDIISDPSCNRKQKTCVNSFKYDSCVNYDYILFQFETQVGAKLLKRLERNSEIFIGMQV